MIVGMERYRRASFAHLPTPIEPLPRLSRLLGANIFVKRDDCTGLATGGNKTRKLEYLIGEAITAGADTLITAGALQSNHARQTAAAAARLGLDCDLVLANMRPGDANYRTQGNVLIYNLVGARIHQHDDITTIPEVLESLAAERSAEGRKPYLIPLGGSTPLGALGYVDAAREILAQATEQSISFNRVVVASSSGGTVAGLATGFAEAPTPLPITAMCVYEPTAAHRDRVLKLVDETARMIGLARPVPEDAITFDDGALGPRYAEPTAETLEAIRMVARSEGLLLDPVYTGKAAAGLISLLRRGAFASQDNILFIHTGGAPGLFAYAHLFADKPRRGHFHGKGPTQS